MVYFQRRLQSKIIDHNHEKDRPEFCSLWDTSVSDLPFRYSGVEFDGLAPAAEKAVTIALKGLRQSSLLHTSHGLIKGSSYCAGKKAGSVLVSKGERSDVTEM